ncbi:(5-formylfuran-3-yl)methyl phosphate synthase [Methylobacterium platani]|uniref:(5-formylfuran-3-yl)methyl phosphate synthase n=1 Tax=Methylobacterium platani TaxID=427683 RepID=UPI003CC9D56B
MIPVPPTSPPRTRLLVSVRDAAEAALARDHGADLIDAKDPDRGALGALPADTVRAIAAAAGDRLSSAVAGEPRDGAQATACLAALAGTGVGYLKIAWAPGRESAGLRLPAGLPVIAVLFAEDGPDGADVPALAAAGFAGAMIDTRGKDGRRLTDHLPLPRLAGFTAACRAHGLLSGLAGSLALDDIPALAALGPGYLGFRGGLCAAADRTGRLDPQRIAEGARRLAAIVPRVEAA